MESKNQPPLENRFTRYGWTVLQDNDLDEKALSLLYKKLGVNNISSEELLAEEKQLNADLKTKFFKLGIKNRLYKIKRKIAFIKWKQNKNGYVYIYHNSNHNYVLLEYKDVVYVYVYKNDQWTNYWDTYYYFNRNIVMHNIMDSIHNTHNYLSANTIFSYEKISVNCFKYIIDQEILNRNRKKTIYQEYFYQEFKDHNPNLTKEQFLQWNIEEIYLNISYSEFLGQKSSDIPIFLLTKGNIILLYQDIISVQQWVINTSAKYNKNQTVQQLMQNIFNHWEQQKGKELAQIINDYGQHKKQLITQELCLLPQNKYSDKFDQDMAKLLDQIDDDSN